MKLLANRRREFAGTIEALLLRGIKTLELAEPVERTCGKCSNPFPATWATQWVCRTCVADGTRLTAEELRQTRAEDRRRRLAAIGLSGDLAAMTFATYQRSLDPAAYDAARGFVEHWAERNLILLGIVGSGKTHLAAAVAHELSDQGANVRYVHVPTLGYELRSAGSGDAWAAVARGRINPLREADVAILDDLGREKSTDAWAEAVDALINYRVNRHAPIVVTANLTANGLRDHLGGAAVSRLLRDTDPVETVAVDRRLAPVRMAPIPESLRDPREECLTCRGAGWVLDGRFRAGSPERLLKCPACAGRGW